MDRATIIPRKKEHLGVFGLKGRFCQPTWCGLEWDPACLAFRQNTRPVRTASVAQVRQPIYKRSVARWKHYEKALGGLFAQL